MNEQLKPCPFCGGDASKAARFNMGYAGDGVKCNKCKAETPFYLVEQKAADWWNTRADGWISVHDKKPKYGTPVILSVNNVVQDITYNLDGSDDSLDWFEPHSSVGAYDDLKDISFFVTHDIDVKWMKLPNPPKAASCGE